MPRPKNKDGANPSDDYGWRWGEPIEGNRMSVRCKFCDRVINGGITRLKEHLAAKRGNVVPCPNVSAEVKKNIAQQLQEYHNEKASKQRRKEELEERIRLGDRGDYGDSDDDDDDEQLSVARRESLRSQAEWEERNSRRARTGQDSVYETGGGSSRSRGVRRSSSVRIDERSGRAQQWSNLDSPGVRLGNMDPILERSKSSKQSKLSTNFLKNAKAKLGKALSKLILHEALPARIVESPFLQPVLEVAKEHGKNKIRGPSAFEVTGVYLDEEYKEIQEWVESFKPIWAERGVTIMCDGWKGTTNAHIINFLIYCPRGTIFKKSIDASSVTSRTAEYYFGLMDEMVEEIGEEFVVQVVTDNEAAVKAGGKLLMQKRPHLYWGACSAHCLDLILEEIGSKTNVKKVLDQAKKITSFIYNHTWTIDLMKRFTKGAELLRPGITRFATNFIALESVFRSRQALKEMVASADWNRSKYSRKSTGLEMVEIINSRSFWTKAADILKVQEPLLKVLRMCDGDEKPTMGFIYEAMDRAKLAIKRDCKYFQRYWDIIDSRWTRQLHNDLHSAGYFLNPQFLYGGNSSSDVIQETIGGVRNVIQRLEPNMQNQIVAMNQLLLYRDKVDSFGTPLAQAAILKTNPAEWWINYGSCAPELQRIAVRVLSQTTSSSNCERNWSTFSLIHTKKRNRLKHRKLQKLVYVHYNMRLKLRHMERRSARELEMGFNPINLDNIFNDDDPLNAWIEERENAILDGENNSEWVSEELLNDTDNEEIDGAEMDDIVPNDESVHILTSDENDDDDDDDDSGGNNGGMNRMDTGHTGSDTSYGHQGMSGYHYNADPGLFPTIASTSSQSKRDRDGSTRERLGEHLQDSYAHSSSPSLTIDENEISESSSHSFHSYQPHALYPPYPGQNQYLESLPYNLVPHPMHIDTSYGYASNHPHFPYNVMPPSYSRGDQNQGSDENSDALDSPRHSFWW